jgi:carbonic anhydrase
MTTLLSRRSLLGCGCQLGAACFAATALPNLAFAASPSTKKTTLTADEALETLKEGNRRYQTDSPVRAVQGR